MIVIGAGPGGQHCASHLVDGGLRVAIAERELVGGDVVFTDPQAASVGDAEGPLMATVSLAEVPRTSTYTRAYDTRQGFMTLVSDGEKITGAHALGPEAGEWLQQATLAIRAQVPLDVMKDVIQPLPHLLRGISAGARGAGGRAAGLRLSLHPVEGQAISRGSPKPLS